MYCYSAGGCQSIAGFGPQHFVADPWVEIPWVPQVFSLAKNADATKANDDVANFFKKLVFARNVVARCRGNNIGNDIGNDIGLSEC